MHGLRQGARSDSLTSSVDWQSVTPYLISRTLKVCTVCSGVLGLVFLTWVGLSQESQESQKNRPPMLVEQPLVGGASEDLHLDKTPPRATKGLDLIKLGWSYDCMECHRSLEPKWHHDQPFVEHQGIVLKHGNNRFCLNCHHPTERNSFVDYDGSVIPESEVVTLCARCHGTHYRDWEAGVHGRKNGYWDSNKGPQTRLRCIQCHDPHQPKFPVLTALPPLKYPAHAAGHRTTSPSDPSKTHEP